MLKRTVRHLYCAALLLLISASGFSGGWTESVSGPNVILLITDDQGYGDLGFHGNPWIRTPHLDELAKESFRLTDFHVGTTCAPTRAGLMTGRNCNRVGVWHTLMGRSLMDKNEVTMADIFLANGYATGMFGKWHLGDNYPYRPHDRGFEQAFYHGGGGVGQLPDYWDNDYFDDTYFRNGDPEKAEGYCTDVWFRNALDFIRKNKDRPFFCYLSTNAPHSPYHVAEEYSDLYKNNPEIPEPNFYGMITQLDENLGIFRDELEKLGLTDNTILIFMTDNGSSAGLKVDRQGFLTSGYNAGMRGKKGMEYNGGHRVPFFIHWPEGGISEGREVGKITSYTDILPTLIELCGLESPELAYDGQSIVPLFRDKDEPWPDRIIITDTQREDIPVKWKKCAIMNDQWHLIRGEELYNMKEDPGQINDVAQQNPEIVSELRVAYEGWWEEISPGFAEYQEIIIDPRKEDPACIMAFDWHSEEIPPWTQGHIRQAIEGNGFWILDVAEAGIYTFSLRRWPLETGLALDASLYPGEKVPGGEIPPAGVSLHFTDARIRVGKEVRSAMVEAGMKSVDFTFDLKPGKFRMQTWLKDTRGITRGAYYVYVSRKVD